LVYTVKKNCLSIYVYISYGTCIILLLDSVNLLAPFSCLLNIFKSGFNLHNMHPFGAQLIYTHIYVRTYDSQYDVQKAEKYLNTSALFNLLTLPPFKFRSSTDRNEHLLPTSKCIVFHLMTEEVNVALSLLAFGRCQL
jgi:hypothetical protein